MAAAFPPRRTVIDRYFARYFLANIKGNPFHDQCVLQHSNKICVVTVAREHPLLKDGPLQKVDFQVTSKLNRLENKVSGKGKKGAQFLQADAPLCIITGNSGVKYTLRSCVKGKLVEVNERLTTMPELIVQKPETDGYIAVVLPKLHESDLESQNLLPNDEYQELKRKRHCQSHDESSSPESTTGADRVQPFEPT